MQSFSMRNKFGPIRLPRKAKKTVDRTAEAALISPGWIEKEKAESGQGFPL